MSNINELMSIKIEEAFKNPKQKFCFYSANGVETGSAMLNAMPHWDWTPYPTYGGGGNTCLVALALGGKPLKYSDTGEWVEPIITAPEQVDEIVIPSVYSGRTGEVIKQIETMAQTLPAGARIRNPDMQAPLGIAEMMWDDNTFYSSLIEAPEAIHKLLVKITDFQINYIRAIQQAAGSRYNPCGFPLIWASGSGTMLADDTISLISPAMHAEFSLPYVNKIAHEVGPIYYHSCTWRASYLDNIRQVENVRAYNWNPGNSDDPATLIREFGGKAVLALHLCLDMHKDKDVLKLGKNFADESELFEYCLDAMTDESCLYWWFSNIRQNGKVMEKIYKMLDERGYTPRAAGLV